MSGTACASRPVLDLAVGADAVAAATVDVDQRRAEALVDFLAQAADVDVHHVGLRMEVEVPHDLAPHGEGDHHAGVAHQVLQTLEHLRLEGVSPPDAGTTAGKRARKSDV